MKRLKPTTPGQRGASIVPFKLAITSATPFRPLTKGFRRGTGRNAFGRITSRHKGGGHKRRFREVDFLYDKRDIRATYETVEYDPNRSAYIALARYADGERRYVLAPKAVKVGGTFIVSDNAPVTAGNRTPLKNLPTGTFVFNIEVKAGGGAKLARSAGNFAEVLARDGGYVQIKLPSSEIRKLPEDAWATVGDASNELNRLRNFGKAGRSRWLGIRPTVRGTAMNPVDHPHGGGEGRSGRGHRRARSMWGKPTGKGQKTRRAKKYSNRLVVTRRKVGKRRI